MYVKMMQAKKRICMPLVDRHMFVKEMCVGSNWDLAPGGKGGGGNPLAAANA